MHGAFLTDRIWDQPFVICFESEINAAPCETKSPNPDAGVHYASQFVGPITLKGENQNKK